MLQLTATVPFSAEFIFLGGQSNEQKTIRGPVTICADCAGQNSDSRAGAEGISDRTRALSGACSIVILWHLRQICEHKDAHGVLGCFFAKELNLHSSTSLRQAKLVNINRVADCMPACCGVHW